MPKDKNIKDKQELTEMGIWMGLDDLTSDEEIKINNWEDLQKIKKIISKLAEDANARIYLIARFIYIVQRDRAYKYEGCVSFREWVQENSKELGGVGLRQIQRYARIWRRLVVELNKEPEEVYKLKPSRAIVVSEEATEDNVDELMEAAKRVSCRNLRDLIQSTDWDNPEKVGVKSCSHKKLKILYKCPECGTFMYKIPDSAEEIIDRAGMIDQDKAKSRNIIIKGEE